ncbi:DUF6113 family protein, partial [Streptomyces sp. NPDC001948]
LAAPLDPKRIAAYVGLAVLGALVGLAGALVHLRLAGRERVEYVGTQHMAHVRALPGIGGHRILVSSTHPVVTDPALLATRGALPRFNAP